MNFLWALLFPTCGSCGDPEKLVRAPSSTSLFQNWLPSMALTTHGGYLAGDVKDELAATGQGKNRLLSSLAVAALPAPPPLPGSCRHARPTPTQPNPTPPPPARRAPRVPVLIQPAATMYHCAVQYSTVQYARALAIHALATFSRVPNTPLTDSQRLEAPASGEVYQVE